MAPRKNRSVVAISAHPDDIELFAGGTVALLAGAGHRVGIRDYPWQIETRARQFGSLVNRRFGEGFLLPGPILLTGPDLLLVGHD